MRQKVGTWNGSDTFAALDFPRPVLEATPTGFRSQAADPAATAGERSHNRRRTSFGASPARQQRKLESGRTSGDQRTNRSQPETDQARQTLLADHGASAGATQPFAARNERSRGSSFDRPQIPVTPRRDQLHNTVTLHRADGEAGRPVEAGGSAVFLDRASLDANDETKAIRMTSLSVIHVGIMRFITDSIPR
jgi:hypothetical protein